MSDPLIPRLLRPLVLCPTSPLTSGLPDRVVDRLEAAAVACRCRAGGKSDDEIHPRPEDDAVARLAQGRQYLELAGLPIDRYVHEAVEGNGDGVVLDPVGPQEPRRDYPGSPDAAVRCRSRAGTSLRCMASAGSHGVRRYPRRSPASRWSGSSRACRPWSGRSARHSPGSCRRRSSRRMSSRETARRSATCPPSGSITVNSSPASSSNAAPLRGGMISMGSLASDIVSSQEGVECGERVGMRRCCRSRAVGA